MQNRFWRNLKIKFCFLKKTTWSKVYKHNRIITNAYDAIYPRSWLVQTTEQILEA